MARRKQRRTASFEGVGKGFAEGQEYLVKVVDCTVEEGDHGPYYSMKLEGTGEFEGSYMYHNASLAPSALWRTREVFEAFLGEVPEGEFDIDEYAEKFIGKYAMVSTFADTYNGSKRIKPEDFWPAEDVPEEEGTEVDLDSLDDAEIKLIGKALKIRSKRVPAIREELGEVDPEELYRVLVDLGLAGDDEAEDEEETEDEGETEDEEEFDLDALNDEEIKELAELVGIRVTERSRATSLRKKLAKKDPDELAEVWAEVSNGGSQTAEELTADEISKMSQDELEELVEEHDLDVDLDQFKTLRKKRIAVMDAAEEAGILAED